MPTRASRPARCSRTCASTSPRRTAAPATPSSARSKRSSCRRGARLEAIEVVVSVTAREIRSWTVREGARPALLFGESLQAMLGVQAHPDWQAALRRRGIEDLSQVQIDPWPAGSFGVAHEDGRRISRCIAYLRETPSDNGYARPIEGLIAFFDQGAGEVLEVVDLGVVPMPPERGSYLPADVGPMRDDLRPLEISQPDGRELPRRGEPRPLATLVVPGGLRPLRGPDAAHGRLPRRRPACGRCSTGHRCARWSSRTAIPAPMHGWKNAFDAGEWGLGRMANSLKLGCDCLGVVQYFDAVLTTEQGEPYTVEHAICLHEEDYGILWKHQDQRGGTDEVRRSRRLVRQLRRHRRQLRVRLLLVLLSRRQHPARGEAHRHRVHHGDHAEATSPTSPT